MNVTDVQPNEFLTGLGPTEFIAVNAVGLIVGRASTRGSIEQVQRNNPEIVEIFSGADFLPPAPVVVSSVVSSTSADPAPAPKK